MSEREISTETPKKGSARTSAKKKQAKGISFEQYTGEKDPFELGTSVTRNRSATLGGRATSGLRTELVPPRLELTTNTGGADENEAKHNGKSAENDGQEGRPVARLKALHEWEERMSVINDNWESPATQLLVHRDRQATLSSTSDTRAEKSLAACFRASHECHARRGEEGAHAVFLHARLEHHLVMSSTSKFQRRGNTPVNTRNVGGFRPESTIDTAERALHSLSPDTAKDNSASVSRFSSRSHSFGSANTIVEVDDPEPPKVRASPESNHGLATDLPAVWNALDRLHHQWPHYDTPVSSHHSMPNLLAVQNALDSPRSHLPYLRSQLASIPMAGTSHNAGLRLPSLRNDIDGPIGPLPRFGFDELVKPTAASETFQDNLDGPFNDADDFPPENLRPAPQNLRYAPFQTQQTHQSRNTPLGSGRLQNASKSGSGPSWGFGVPNGVSALPSTQSRQTGAGATSFAQTIGGPPPAASLDLSEFPSLSGTSQPQYQNQSQAIWANQRAVQQTPVQRPQQQHSMTSQAPQQHQQTQQAQDQSQRTSEDMFSASSHLPNAMDDHLYGGTGTLGQLPASRQPQTTNVDDFPPLGRNGTDENDDRRSTMMQNSGFGGFSSANAFSMPSDQAQARNTLPSASSSQANNTRSSSVVDRLTSPNGVGYGASSSGRSPIEPIRQGTIGQDQDRNNTSAAQRNQRNENTMNSLLNNFSEMQFQPQRQTSQPQQQDYVTRTGDAPGSAVTPDRPPPSQMSALEEFGLAGFLATARSENPDVSGLARGQELTSLGLNLNSPEPLYPSFGGPFSDVGSRPMQPDYKLPECYVVDNVHRVTDKVPSFHDETLFFIFYTQTRDILQELAATELTNRNWRYHKELRMWLTKDVSQGEPVQISPEKEQGSYSFWNPQTWEKMRVTNFELHYQQLAPSVSRPTF